MGPRHCARVCLCVRLHAGTCAYVVYCMCALAWCCCLSNTLPDSWFSFLSEQTADKMDRERDGGGRDEDFPTLGIEPLTLMVGALLYVVTGGIEEMK